MFEIIIFLLFGFVVMGIPYISLRKYRSLQKKNPQNINQLVLLLPFICWCLIYLAVMYQPDRKVQWAYQYATERSMPGTSKIIKKRGSSWIGSFLFMPEVYSESKIELNHDDFRNLSESIAGDSRFHKMSPEKKYKFEIVKDSEIKELYVNGNRQYAHMAFLKDGKSVVVFAWDGF